MELGPKSTVHVVLNLMKDNHGESLVEDPGFSKKPPLNSVASFLLAHEAE